MGRKPKLVGERMMGWNGLKLAYSRRDDVIAGTLLMAEIKRFEGPKIPKL